MTQKSDRPQLPCCPRGMKRRDFPLVKVCHELRDGKWDLRSYLKCGHWVEAPIGYGGAQSAERRRCFSCPPRPNRNRPPLDIWPNDE